MIDWNNLTDAQFLNLYGYPRNPPAPPPFAKWEQPWNSMQLASYPAGRALVAAINAKLLSLPPNLDTPRPMGGGVLPADDESADPELALQITGLFVPPFYGLAPRSETGPDGTKYFQLHMRFHNGAIIDVGLFLDKLSRFPLSQDYALSYLAAQVEASGNLPVK